MTTIGEDQQPGRAWGVAAVPSRTVGPVTAVGPSSEPDTAQFAPVSPRHRAGDRATDRPGDRPTDRPTERVATAGRPAAIDPSSEEIQAIGDGWVGREPPKEHKRPRGQGRSRFWTGLRTTVVLIALVGGAGTGGYYLLRQRVAAAAFVDLGTVTLTADPMPIGFADSAVVVSVSVAEQDRVTADQEVAKVRTATDEIVVLRAPSSGAVAAVKVGPGGLVRGGEPVIVLYDPERTTFQADVPVESLQRLRIGMAAQISGPGLASPIMATLDHVVPVMNARPTGELTVVLLPVPERRPDVAKLLPGLPFTASVDTNSAATSVPAVNAG